MKYCKDCKHYYMSECFNDDNTYNGNYKSPHVVRFYRACYELNKDNKCNNYKRKWYKFWIKE